MNRVPATPLPALLLALLLAACSSGPEVIEPPPLPERSGPTFAELQDAALAAYRAKRYGEMERLLRQSERLRPHHPRALYNLAAARALQGDADGALAFLTRLEDMKLTYPVWEDADFAALRDDPRFKAQVEKFRKRLEPQGIAQYAFTAGVNSFMPEGIAYDEENDAYYLSSVRERRVLRIDRDDRRTTLVGSGERGLMAALGMIIEPRTRRLWVASSGLPAMQRYDEAEHRGRAGIFAFDKDTGQLRGRYWLPIDGREHVLGEVIIGGDGTIYTTDSAAGTLYALDRKSGKFTALTKPGELESPQGITFAPGRRHIYIADYNQGLLRYDLERGRLEKIPGRDDVCLYGIDGLYYYKSSLVAIQNGVQPHRVVRIDLDEKGELPRVIGMQVLAASHPDFDEPTLGVLKRNDMFYFVANSHWNRLDASHRLPPDSQLSRPVVLRIDLRRKIGPVATDKP
jgi:sugar lactone lactonase YvrE